jgi:thiol-disulfide isomerase/thioredoxin
VALRVTPDQLAASAAAAKIPIDAHRDGTRGIYIHDPFGNAVELISYPPGETIYGTKASYYKEKFDAAFDYDRYLMTGTEEQQRRWKQVYDLAILTDAQAALVKGFVRQMHILIVSGIWCGDCVQQVPLIQRIADANPGKVHLHILDRDQHRDLAEQVRINTGDRVPVALFLAEDFEWCATFGDRTISRYTAIAARQLGAACPIGVIAPDQNEMAATLADWLAEIERVQLMLRLSGRLRQKHGD